MLDLFGIAWMPYQLVSAGKRLEELPAYSEEE